MNTKIEVDAESLRIVLQALTERNPHDICRLRDTTKGDMAEHNPINVLCDQYHQGIEKLYLENTAKHNNGLGNTSTSYKGIRRVWGI